MTGNAWRVRRVLASLCNALSTAAELAGRGRVAYDEDPALPLAFEALCSRVGDLAKRLVRADPILFDDPIWSRAAQNRDFVVHQYDRIDLDLLWATVTRDFPLLDERIASLPRADL